MIPIKLIVSGFLSYRDPVTIDFSSFDLACIAGANGAGKSSLLDAITYALFGKARKTDETIINLQSDAAFVELTFEYESNRYRVQRTNPRGKTTMLEFQMALPLPDGYDLQDVEWKALTERTVRETQRRIEETLRLDYEIFINAAFFLQGKADRFTQQTPARRKAILSSILGLDIWETYRQRTLVRRRGIEREVQAIDGRLAEINSELSQEGERLRLLEALNAELDRLAASRNTQEAVLDSVRKIQVRIGEQQRLVETLARQAELTRRRLSGLEKRQAVRSDERDRYAALQSRETEVRAAYNELQEFRRQLAEWDLAARDHEKERQGPRLEIEKRRAILDAELLDLIKRQAEASENETAIAALEEQMAELESSLDTVHAALAGREPLEKELTAAREKLAEARAENPRLKSEMETLRQRIDRLEEAPEDAALCPLCGQPLSLEHRSQLVADLSTEGKRKGDQYRANRELLQEADERVGSLEAAIAAFKGKEAEERRISNQRLQLEGTLVRQRDAAGAWLKTGAPRLAEIERQLSNDGFAAEAREELARIDAALKATGYDAAEHDRIRSSVQGADEIEEDMRVLERAAAALEPLNRELGELESEIRAATEELQRQEGMHQDAVAALAVSLSEAPDLAQTQRDLLALVEQENQLRMKVGSAQQKVDVLGSLKRRKIALEEQRAGKKRLIARLQQLERAFGKDGVPALLIEQAIPQIETKANELLERLSAGEMSIRFQTQRELKSRTDLKETLDITISDRAGIRDYELYSGGEAFRINFAIRLALSEVLARRAGARLQTLVIDEGFGSQDEIGRQRLIEAISLVREDFEKVLVITHIEALKEAFPTRIEVTKGANGSTVSLINA